VDKEEIKEIILDIMPGTIKVLILVILYSCFFRIIL